MRGELKEQEGTLRNWEKQLKNVFVILVHTKVLTNLLKNLQEFQESSNEDKLCHFNKTIGTALSGIYEFLNGFCSSSC